MDLTLRQMEILAAAADSATFSAAAAKLGISQPAFSEAVRRIEREIGTVLFERTTRSVRLTDDGRRIANVARELVQDFRRGLERLASAKDRGRVVIAALPSVACAAIPRALATFSRAHPTVDVALHDVQHERAIAMLHDGLADFAVTLKPAPSDDLAFEGVVYDTAHLVCRRDHPLARRRKVGWRDLADYTFVGITPISSVRRLTDAAFVHDEIAVAPRYEVEQVPSAIALVEAGLGITALPSLTFAMFKNHGLATRPLTDPVMRRHIGFVTRAQRPLPAFATDLMRVIRDEVERATKVGRR